ncbi:hypothetical protein BSL78_20348 [Apostichopus japonicus]|uniref:Ig-like domain-containing protein n=1 Tax=Stichopus japonicus TaxID=307972 RepID=A0A2G8K483_STIJA|nr:hypothetical protein BSL78_20348 [Apostichopus japonicus]
MIILRDTEKEESAHCKKLLALFKRFSLLPIRLKLKIITRKDMSPLKIVASILMIVVAGSSISDAVVCNDTKYIEYDHEEIISCSYDRTFYTVRWQKDNSTETILRIDGMDKSGSGLSSGKYDIKDDGSMVIPRVEFSHEGLYTISVLQDDGHLLRDSIMVRVSVPLKDLTIHDCFLSDHELCKKTDKSEGESSLRCIQCIDNSKRPSQYDDRTSRETYVLEGKSLPLSCPRPNYPFGLLSATFSNRSSTIIMEWELHIQPRCPSPWNCEFSGNDLVSIVVPTYNISLECVSSSGVMATTDVIHVSTVDNSLKSVVSIDGCGSGDQMCERTTGLIGNISCSLLNNIPGIKLTFRQSESHGVTISREWHYTDENHSTNTFENYVISEYHISQCDEVTELSCSPASVEIAKFQNTAVIHLKPDTSECQVPKNGSSKTVTAVVIVIIVCVLMISVLAATFFIKRRGRSKREPGSSGMNMSEIESQDTDTADPKHNESTNTEHEKEPLLQGPLATDGEFQRLLIESKDLHKDTEVREFLGKSISNLNPSKEELLAIANFFSTSKWISHKGLVAVLQTVLEMKQIPSKVGLDIVMELFNKEKIDLNGFIDITKMQMKQKKIKAEDVLKRLRIATTENKIPPATTAEMLTKYYVLNLLTKKDLDKSIHMGFSKPKEKIPFLYILLVIEELHSESENKEKLIELFNAIVAKLKSELEYSGAELSNFNHLEESDLEYNGEALSELKDLEEMDFSKAISAAITFIVDGRMLDVDTLMDILQKRSLKEKVTGTLLTTVLFDLLQNEKIELYRYISELKTCLVAHQISSSDFVRFLSAPLNDEKVCIRDFITEMQDCRHQNVITKEQYSSSLSSLPNYKQFKLDEFIKAYDEGWKRGIKINEANFRSLMSNFLRQRKVKLEDYLAEVKTIKDECQITDQVFEKLLSVALEYEEINVEDLIQGITAWGKEAVISPERFWSFLIECAKCDKINTQKFLEEVKTWRREDYVNNDTIFKFTMSLLKENTVDKESFLTFTMSLLKEDLVDKESFLTFMMSLQKEDLVDKESFLAFTMSLLKEDLVDKESFLTFTMSLQKEDLVDKESFLTFTMSLLKEDLIDESTALPIIQSVIDKFKITKKDMANISDVVDKKLYKKMKFHSDKGDK